MKSLLDDVLTSIGLEPSYKDANIALIHGDCRDILEKIPATRHQVGSLKQPTAYHRG